MEGSEYVELLRELSEIGAHGHIETPSICVVGVQSAGKSSLIQRICGIPLPRSDGTCTRCPMEVMLIPASTWSCTVRIRTEWDHASNKKLDKVEEHTYGSVITNVEDVELRIKQAQKAVLNPRKSAESFLDHNFPEGIAKDAATNELPFSPNLVVLEVRGAPYSLTLIDLPGIIHNTQNKEDEDLIGLIEVLVLSYISKPRTIIVAALSCKNDIDNQKVLKLAREVPHGEERTLGVLTKPDTIERGCHEAWLQVMRGNTRPLNLGYFMVRNATKLELDQGLSREQSDQLEARFFEESEELRELREDRDLSQRVGVPCLVGKLSELLIGMVQEQLPEMKKSVEDQLKESRANLDKLPPTIAPKDRADVLQQALRALGRDAEQLIKAQGSLSSKHFAQRRAAITDDLARNVASTRPRFKLFTKQQQPPARQATTQQATTSNPAVGATNGAGFFAGFSTPPRSSVPVFGAEPAAGASTDAAPAPFNPFSFGAPVPNFTFGGNAPSRSSAPAFGSSPNSMREPEDTLARYGGDEDGLDEATHHPSAPVLSLSEVKEIVAKERSYELPHFLPYSALVSVIKKFQGVWDDFAWKCLHDSASLLKGEINILVDKHFGHFNQAKLAKLLKTCAEELVAVHVGRTQEQIQLLIEMESVEDSPPFTANAHYYTDSYTKIFDANKAQLRRHKTRYITDEEVSEKLSAAMSALAGIPGLQGLTQEQLLGRLQTLPEEEEELKIASATMAYFKVSSKRYIDYVALFVSTLLMRRVAMGLEESMDRYLRSLAGSALDGNRPSDSTSNSTPAARGRAAAQAGAPLRQWQDSEAVLSLVANDPALDRKRGQLEAKLDSLQRTARVLARFA